MDEMVVRRDAVRGRTNLRRAASAINSVPVTAQRGGQTVRPALGSSDPNSDFAREYPKPGKAGP